MDMMNILEELCEESELDFGVEVVCVAVGDNACGGGSNACGK